MPTNTSETQPSEVGKSFEKGVFPPQIKVFFGEELAVQQKLKSLKKEFKKAKRAFKTSKEKLKDLQILGKSKKQLAKAKQKKKRAKTKKLDLEKQIKVLEMS